MNREIWQVRESSRRVTVLIAGEFSFFPLGRHTLSFVQSLSEDPMIDIYLDVTLHEHAKSLYKKFLKQENVQLATKLDRQYVYDFLFYTQFLPNYWDHCLYKWLGVSNRKAHVKGFYCVFDGTIPPLHWVDFINENFDVCLTPTRFVANNLKTYGVNICCMGLHALIHTDSYLAHVRKKKNLSLEKFKFGFIGTLEPKKDVRLAVDAFVNEFSNIEPVEFHLHSTDINDPITQAEVATSLQAAREKGANISVTKGHIAQEDIEKIFCSFDGYVFPEKITGFFTTLLESLSIGIPVITSKIPPLWEITDYIDSRNHIFWLDAKEMVPIFPTFANHMLLGVGFQSKQSDLQKVMREMFENRHKLLQDNLIAERKEAGTRMSNTHYRKKWIHLVKPPNICITKDSYFDIFEDVFFMSKKLAKLYKEIYGQRGYTTKRKDVRVRPNDSTPYWYANLPEYQFTEKIAFYHQRLLRLLLAESQKMRAGEFPERVLLNILKTLPSVIFQILASPKRIAGILRKVYVKIGNRLFAVAWFRRLYRNL